MKHITSKLLSLLLCLAMLMSMVPVAYATNTESTDVDDVSTSENSVALSGDETEMPVSGNAVSTNEELATAIANAADGATITLGEGEFTTYGNTSPNKSLTFVGAGEKTVWTIGNLTADVGGEGNGDYSFDGCDTITFKNMTLKSDVADYRGFIRINNTVVENCTLEGKTAYWGYTTATFTGCTFEAPEGDYALWDYSTPSMTFNNCTFNISGKGINVYVEAGNAGNVTRTVAVNGCTVDSTKANKAFLNIKNSTQSYDVTFSGTNTVNGLAADSTTASNLYQVETTEATETSGRPVTVQEKAADGTLTVLYEVKPAAQPTAVAKVDNVEYSTLQAAIDAAKGGSTVRLLDNVTLTEPAVFPAGKKVDLNLLGHNITAAGLALLVNGTTDILGTGGGTIESTNNVAVAVGDNAKLTVYSGTLKGREGAVITGTSTGAKIEIRKNATLIATDNAVIAGNGSERDGMPNTILVKGGTFIGGIQSDGYIACGIYAPWNDNVTVSGGTFNITNGAGIVARAGTVKVTGGTFNCTGTSTGWVGDNKNLLPCAALVFDAAANYPALTNSSQILVSGGKFSTNPAANGATLADGYVATETDGTYSVGKSNPAAEIDGVKYDTLQAAITAAGATKGGATITLLKNINTESYYAVNGDNKVTIDLAGYNITGSGISGLFYVTAKGDLTIKGEGTVTAVEDNGAAMAVWVRSPIAKVTLEGGTYTQQITNTSDNHFDLIYVEYGTAYIKGGTYEGATPVWTLNCKDENYKAGTAKIEVTGGTFKGFDPANNTAEGESTNFIPAGYGVTVDADGNFSVTESANYVAAIGETKYTSLAEAIKEANKGATVKLLRDTKENVTIDKAMTLDLNGFTLNGSTGERKPALTITERYVTIMDSSAAQTGTIMREDTAENSGVSSHYVIDIQDNAFVTFKSGNVKNDSGAGGTKGASLVRIGTDDQPTWKPQLTIEGGTFTQDNFIVLKVGGYGTLYVKGGTINSKNSYAVENWSFAVIKDQAVVNGKVSSWTYQNSLKKNELEIRGGTVNGDVEAISYDGVAGKRALVSISGGTVNGTLMTGIYGSATEPTKDMATIEVTGGTFSKDPSKYVVEGSTATKNDDGTYGVAKAFLAKVGDTSYYTMDEASAAQTASGKPIVLLRDYTTGSPFSSGSIDRVVDLNGHTWTCTGKDANSAAFAINNPNVSLTVKNGKIVSSQLVGLIPSAMGGTIKYDNSNLVFDGVEMSTTATSGIETNGNNTNDSVTLKNSTLNVPNGFGIYFPSSGTLTIDNSTINAKTMGVQVCAGSLSINAGSTITVSGGPVEKTENDGAIQDGAAISIVNRTGYKGLGKIEVTGGTFKANGTNAAIKAYDWNNANKKEDPFTESDKVAVSGGTFSSIPTNMNDLCADGYIPVKNEDGYAVQTGTYVASIGTKNFATLADAIAAAKDGDTVKLIADVEQNVPLTINKNITLDLNGKKIYNTVDLWDVSNAVISIEATVIITGNGSIEAKENDCYTINVKNGSLTIENGTFVGNVSVVQVEKGTLTINGGEFKLLQKWKDSSKYLINCIDDNYVNKSAVVDIRGGKFVDFDPNVSPEKKVDGKAPSFVISAGIGVTKDAAGNFTAVPNMAAQIVDENGGSVKAYATLQEAVNAANGQTVILLADTDITSDGLTIAASKSITLDLSGHSLKAANTNAGNIKVLGTLTLTDSTDTAKDGTGRGKVYTDTPYGNGKDKVLIAAIDGGTFIMESGLIDAASFTTDNAKKGQFAVSVQNENDDATVIINGGHIKAGWYAVAGNGQDVKFNGNITVNGGILESTADYAIYHPHAGTTTINGGTVYGAAGGVSLNRGKLVVNGGTITSKGTGTTGDWGDGTGRQDAAAINVNAQYDTTSVEIKGGTITAEKNAILLTNGKDGTIAVSGGTFSSAVKPEYCATGFEPKDNSNGTYGVKAAEGNAAMFDAEGKLIGYADVAAAMADEKAATVKLIANATAKVLALQNNITLDLNGYELDAQMLVGFAGTVIDSSEGEGLLKLANRDYLTLANNNSYLPLYDTVAQGYRFFSYQFKARGIAGSSADSRQFWFSIVFGSDKAYTLLKNAGHGLEIRLSLQVGTNDAMEAVVPQQAIALWVNAIKVNGGTYEADNAGFYMAVKGLSKIGDDTVTVTGIAKIKGVEVKSDGALIYPKTN